MFSGIVEECAVVTAIEHELDNVHLTLRCSFTHELGIDQSVAHNGVCLTVVRINGDEYTVTAMRETLDRSNLGDLRVGDQVNVERSMQMNGRLDGHIVQGHVDQTAECIAVEDAQGSHVYTFRYRFDREMALRGYFTVDKGSVTVNGVSLTVCNPTEDTLDSVRAGSRSGEDASTLPAHSTATFTVCIIPYTFDNTNFHNIQPGTRVNLEFDIIGKYLARMNQLVK